MEAEAAQKIATETNDLHWLSIPSSSSNINNYQSNYCSPASITIKSGEQSIHVFLVKQSIHVNNSANLDDALHIEQGFPSSEDHLNELEMNNVDLACSEYKKNGKEQTCIPQCNLNLY